MPSTSGSDIVVRLAQLDDLPAVKRLADAHRYELGFVLLPSLRKQIEEGEMIVAEQDSHVIGFVDYHIRRDKQLTLYHIAVEPVSQRQGVGKAVLEALEATAQASNCACILLKCPVDLAANQFYKQEEYELVEVLNGRKRPLNVWKKSLET